jgi:hypothetical protein
MDYIGRAVAQRTCGILHVARLSAMSRSVESNREPTPKIVPRDMVTLKRHHDIYRPHPGARLSDPSGTGSMDDSRDRRGRLEDPGDWVLASTRRHHKYSTRRQVQATHEAVPRT